MIKDNFPTMEAAKYHIIENAADLIKRTVEKFGMPHLEKVERIGPDFRGGEDCTPEMFLKTFGFRGVEFGNWVPDAERREILNFAFDAFCDLADVLGVDPRFISLNGELSAAFGSRGTSEALAHYEPGYFVFNLTRMNGAGSLAHEWFHAFDNYRAGVILNKSFARAADSAALIDPIKSYATEKTTRENSPEIDAFSFLSRSLEVKKEKKPVVFDDLLKKIDHHRDRLSAELDKVSESLTKEIRDYRGNVRRGGKPATAAQKKAFDAVCSRILAGEFGEYKFHGSFRSGTYYYSCLNDLSKAFKAVRGRSGLIDRDTIISIHPYIGTLERALKDCEKMRGVSEIEVPVKTNFRKMAEKMDAARAKPYWASVIEMGARAFAAYVDDRLQASGRKNDYLVRATDNSFYKFMFGVEVFPEGEERAAIHQAFNALFTVVAGHESALPMPDICNSVEPAPYEVCELSQVSEPAIIAEAEKNTENDIKDTETGVSPVEIIAANVEPKQEQEQEQEPGPDTAPIECKSVFDLVDYSEKAIAVFGDTQRIKDKLKEIGGKFNGRLKRGESTAPGWIFSKKRRSDVVALLAG